MAQLGSVLFTHSYFYKFDPKQWKSRQPYPPLATITAAALIRQSGFSVSMFDTNLENSPEKLTFFLQRERPVYVVIYDDGFNYLTKMCLTKMREAAFDLAKRAKKFGCTVIVSSSDSTDHYEKYFPWGVDYVIKGEGEETLLELLTTLEKRGDVSPIKGLAFKKLGQTVITQPRAIIRDLDVLPLPAWDLIDIKAYRKIWKKHHGYFSLNLATTRGCPYKCNWCAKPIYGNRYNSRSPAHVVSEIEMLMNNFQPAHFWMADDIFGLKPGWPQEFLKLIKAKNLKFKYKIQSRADLLLEEDNMEVLAASGAETIWIGAESGSQKILDAMDKGTTVDQIRKSSALIREKGIKLGLFIQFGYPGETSEDIDKTIEMILEIMPDEVGISISYPLPGTKFYENVKSQLTGKQNWSDSDDLDMMFNSQFNSNYYKQLHRYVHSIYQKHKGYSRLKKIFTAPADISYADLRSGLKTFYYIPRALAQGIKLRKLKNEAVNLNVTE
jgi:anaerobic magnesium-protoporphyrin IX monomethyl ester cyclase